ncbi:MAG: glycosyltransferase family 2 protein [Clostridiales bacterium]|jgi:rhamnosyltransferase|nr:glycosyltransferase family 2 protein [Clostridiales bacterium]
MSTSVDVIIPVYNPDNKLFQLLLRLEKQTIRPKNILIFQTVDASNEIEPIKIPENMSISLNIYYVNKNDFDHGGTRRFGASQSKADILIYMTQDAIPADKYLIERLIQPYKDSQVSATYGRQLANSKADIIERYTRQFNYPDESHTKSIKDIETLGIKAFFCSNVCASYRRDIYEKLGGFVERTIFNEDMIMAYTMIKAGYKISYKADARVIHSHNYSYLQQFSRNFDLGVSHRQYADIFLGVSSESEGIRLVKDTLGYLMEQKEYLLIPDLIISSGFKYLGYKLGVNYDKLPKNMVLHCSMNKGYWKDGVR